jgi:predicted TIM-barrel fold metal-dependent hydrolase
MTEPPRERIWDLHCHLTGVPGRTPDELMAALIARADRMGIERLIVFMGYPMVMDPPAVELRRQNDQVLQALSHWHHRAFGFAYVSPNHVEASLREIDRCVRDGPMVGIKLWVARRCNDPAIDPIIARAGELKAAIYQHTWIKAGGSLPGESLPGDLVALAARHPNTPLICGHTGGNWELGIRTVRATSNISIDLAGSDPTAGFVEMAVRELGPNRIIYGSDVGGRGFASQLSKVRSTAISAADRGTILGGNLRAMLAPILRAKGVAIEP